MTYFSPNMSYIHIMQDAWHYSRSLLDRASTASNGSGSGVRRLVNLFVSRLSADGRLNEFIGGTYPIQVHIIYMYIY